MANRLYGRGRNKFLEGSIQWVSHDVTVALIDTADYTVSIDADEFLSDIPTAAIVATASLTGKTAVLGVADASDTTFPAVTGDESEAVVLYRDTGTSTTSPLIAYIDVATGLPVLPNSGDIVIQWDSGSNRIFKL